MNAKVIRKWFSDPHRPRVAGGDAVAAVLPLETGVAVGAGLPEGAVEVGGVAAGVAAAVEADSAEADFFERLFFGAAAPLSADAAVLAVESPATAVVSDFLLGLAVSEVDAEAEEAEASLLSAEADFFERLFLGAEAVELSAVAFSSLAVGFVDLLFFFEDAVPASADACEDDVSAEAVSAFFFFLVFFLLESVWP